MAFHGANKSTTKFQFCSSGIKEISGHMNKELLTDDIASRKEKYEQSNSQACFDTQWGSGALIENKRWPSFLKLNVHKSRSNAKTQGGTYYATGQHAQTQASTTTTPSKRDPNISQSFIYDSVSAYNNIQQNQPVMFQIESTKHYQMLDRTRSNTSQSKLRASKKATFFNHKASSGKAGHAPQGRNQSTAFMHSYADMNSFKDYN